MSIELKKNETEAWDQFATVALKVVLAGRPISGDVAAQTAALVADSLIQERRKREAEPGKL